MVIVSYGGGVNSTAMLVGLWERRQRPNYILFADTGDEKPHTYEFIWTLNIWLIEREFPSIQIVRGSYPRQQKDGSLYNESYRLGKLPAKAYGLGSCSMKWKIEPQQKLQKFLAKQQGLSRSEITILVGFDAGEPQRIQRALDNADKKLFPERYPLSEWEWGREECLAAIERAGLPNPGKSACFYCPSSKKHEIRELAERYPELFAKAVDLERRALAGEGQAPRTTSAGLGRQFSWAELIRSEKTISEFDVGMPEIDCGCYDGE